MSTDLPTEICREILTWLPTKPLLEFRRVCKEWRTIIDELGFAKAQADNQIARSCEDLLLIRAYGYLLSFSLSSLNEPKTGEIETRKFRNVNGHRSLPSESKFPVSKFPVSTCHGLIVIMYHQEDHHRTWFNPFNPWILWNPFTGEQLELPSYKDLVTAESDRDIWFGCGGIGYDVATDDYKVVRLSKPVLNGDYTTRTLIYSMKWDKWRRIEDLHNSDQTVCRKL